MLEFGNCLQHPVRRHAEPTERDINTGKITPSCPNIRVHMPTRRGARISDLVPSHNLVLNRYHTIKPQARS